MQQIIKNKNILSKNQISNNFHFSIPFGKKNILTVW